MDISVSIQSIKPVTHNVRCIRIEKPGGYEFTPGQATEVAIGKPGWEDQKRPFTFTSLAEDPFLEFTIKSYTDHEGVTNEIAKLQPGDRLLIGDVWGAIEYKGPGYFIAGGAGITPFLAILRRLAKDGQLAGNTLFFSNRTAADIICKEELAAMPGLESVFILTDGSDEKHRRGYIDAAFLQQHVRDLSRHCYICGPDPMVAAISDILLRLGARPDAVVFEK